jgi:hypothetical protein
LVYHLHLAVNAHFIILHPGCTKNKRSVEGDAPFCDTGNKNLSTNGLARMTAFANWVFRQKAWARAGGVPRPIHHLIVRHIPLFVRPLASFT